MSFAAEAGTWLKEKKRVFPWALIVGIGSSSEVQKELEALPSEAVYWADVEVRQDLPGFLSTGSMRAELEQLPLPPFQAAEEIQLLREAGPLLFTQCRTNTSWKLEADAIVVPISPTGEFGSLGDAMNTYWDSSQTLRSIAKHEYEGKTLIPAMPISTQVVDKDGTSRKHTVFFATAQARGRMTSVEDVVVACLASIKLASKTTGIETLVLPLVGWGKSDIDPKRVIVGLFDGFAPHVELGDLKHVIFVVETAETFAKLRDAEPLKLVRAKQMENDMPGGEDRLGVETDIIALADSIALKDLEPPLVVGILGGWGTGKSFALHLLEKRLTEIRCWDLRDEHIRDEFPFVGHVYLVKFDAWTYAKKNLWAS